MAVGIVGRKRGMAKVFTEEGRSISVTVIEAGSNRVTQLLDPETSGYRAVQVAWGRKKPIHIRKPEAGLFAKANINAAEGLIEYRLTENEAADLSIGSEIKVNIFQSGQKVDVAGTTKGKGFAGVIKRHNFRSQRMSHGNSLAHRAPGSIGQCQTPGRVFKGKKMAGQLGGKRRTIQNLEVVRVDDVRNLLLIKGAVPAVRGGKVIIKPTVKRK